MRGLPSRIEWRRTQRTLKTGWWMSNRTLTRTNGTGTGYSGACLRAATPGGLLLRLHLRGNQLRIRQRVSIFPQGTGYTCIIFFFLFSCLINLFVLYTSLKIAFNSHSFVYHLPVTILLFFNIFMNFSAIKLISI